MFVAAACSGDAKQTSPITESAANVPPAEAAKPTQPAAAAGSSAKPMMTPPAAASAVAGARAQAPVTMAAMPNAAAGAAATSAAPAAATTAPASAGASSMTTAAAGAAAMGTMTPPAAGGGILPKVSSTEEDGPFEATSEVSGNFFVYRPTELGKDGLKHPIFVWGTGAGALPERYMEYFPRFATHGIVVVSPNKTDKAASDMKAAVDWIIAQNDDAGSPFHQKLDTMRIGMGGHSQGSVATFDQEGMEDRLKTTIHIAGGSFDMRGSSKVKTPTAYICGETDFALPNCEADFETVADQPTFFSVLMGVDHVACARNAMPGMISWLRWHLGGESERAAEFTGPDGKFHMGIWKSQTKNWSF